MRKIRLALIAGALTAIVVAIAPAASAASAANVRCVGHPPCFATLQKAVDAANEGGVILLEPGTYSGGVSIDKSVEVIGSGASRTIIKGGKPVLTIGKAFAQSEPEVTISKVEILRKEKEDGQERSFGDTGGNDGDVISGGVGSADNGDTRGTPCASYLCW